MRCNDVQDLLAAYLDGGIADADTRADIATHLEGCPICRAERDSLAGTLADVASAMKAAGDAIAIPDVQWSDMPARTPTRTLMRPIFRQKESAYSNNHNGSKPLMQDDSKVSMGRRAPLAGVLTFAISLAVLFVGWLIFNASMRGGVGAAPDETATPTPEYIVITETPTPLPTETPAPTVDPLTITGGFVDNQVDVSTLPEYEVTGGGGSGGGGGGGCPLIEPTETVLLVGDMPVSKMICLYDLPDASEGARFTVRLTSPEGKEYSEDFKLMPHDHTPGLLAVVKAGSSIDFGTLGFLQPDEERNVFDITLHFLAAQEYGEWQIEGSTEQGVFASGKVNIVANEPIYSVTPINQPFFDPLDPFEMSLGTGIFLPGQRALFAGRGLEAGKETLLTLYSWDPKRTNNSVTVWVPYYGTQITIGEDGTYRTEFVVGSDTFGTRPGENGAYYTAVFDPQPGEFEPEMFGLAVNP